VDSVFVSPMLTSAAENRQRLFDNNVMHSWLIKIDSLNDTEHLLFRFFLVNQYGMKFHFFAVRICRLNQTEYLPNEFFTSLTSKLCDEINDRNGRYNVLRVLRDTIDSGKFQMEIDWVIYKHYTDGLCKRIWNSEIVKALGQGFLQGDLRVWPLVSELYRQCGIYGMSYICA
jgi:hypothetical protein